MDIRKIAVLVLPLGVFLMMLSMSMAATNEPGPIDNITTGTPERFNGKTDGFAIQAEAGNVTAMVITDTQPTNYWQGYYGNITGTITLDDASNNTLYSWSITNPEGEIYAVNHSGTVLWPNVTCVNLSAVGANNTPDLRVNLTQLNDAYGINYSARDSFNETFNTSLSTDLIVGLRTLSATGDQGNVCPQATTYVDDVWQSTMFRETIIHDNGTSLIFVTILEENQNGFRIGSDPHDFQMIVAEDGSPGGPDTTPTTYYFYVELQ